MSSQTGGICLPRQFRIGGEGGWQNALRASDDLWPRDRRKVMAIGGGRKQGSGRGLIHSGKLSRPARRQRDLPRKGVDGRGFWQRWRHERRIFAANRRRLRRFEDGHHAAKDPAESAVLF